MAEHLCRGRPLPCEYTPPVEGVLYLEPKEGMGEADRLTCQDADDVFVIRYPQTCSGSPFEEDYAKASAALLRRAPGFALMHDLRDVKLTTLDRKAVLQDAQEIAGGGRLRAVAFVLGCSSFWQRIISAMVSRFSPVKPSKVFNDVVEARAWCLSACATDRPSAGEQAASEHAPPQEPPPAGLPEIVVSISRALARLVSPPASKPPTKTAHPLR